MDKANQQSDASADQVLTEQQHFWLKHLQSCQASGKSMAEYAREHGLKVKSFYYWKKRLLRLDVTESDRDSKSPVFHQVKIQPAAVLRGACCVRFPNGIECELSPREVSGLEQLLVTVSRLPR